MKKKVVLALVATLLAGSVIAQVKPESAIKYRQSGYAFMGWNMGKLKGMLIDNPDSFNKDQAVAAANAIQAIANSGMGALYVPGSDKGKGWEPTRVKAELFTDKEGVGKVGESCKACHEKFREEEHKH